MTTKVWTKAIVHVHVRKQLILIITPTKGTIEVHFNFFPFLLIIIVPHVRVGIPYRYIRTCTAYEYHHLIRHASFFFFTEDSTLITCSYYNARPCQRQHSALRVIVRKAHFQCPVPFISSCRCSCCGSCHSVWEFGEFLMVIGANSSLSAPIDACQKAMSKDGFLFLIHHHQMII